MSKNMACLILAAGKGTRMNSDIPKPLHSLHNRPMLGYLTESVTSAGVKDITLVLGHKADEVKKVFLKHDAVVQKEQLGSGDAVNSARKHYKNFKGQILVLYADVPLLKTETIRHLLKEHKKSKASVTMLTSMLNNPTGYGRIVRNSKDNVVDIVEEKDADRNQKQIKEVNIGVYVFDAKILFDNLSKIKMNKKKKEYYLTDIIKICAAKDVKVKAIITQDEVDGMGINSKVELAQAEKIIKERVLTALMKKGVTIISPETTFIDKSVKVGKDTVIYPNTVIEQNVSIGKGCKIGPFARIRPGSKVKDNVYVGTFVEIVRTVIGDNTKVGHQTYLGDAIVGKDINIGAGTITANYDGKNKNKTIIGNGAFIGVGTKLIAPVKVGSKAVTGAGSVITKNHNVPARTTVAGVPAKIIKNKKPVASSQ